MINEFWPQLEQPSRCCGLLRKDTGVVFRLRQEDQLGSLDLVTNVIILWNTLYMESVLNQLRQDDYTVLDEDVARLSHLIHEHINMLGRYLFAVPDAVAKGEFRAFRKNSDSPGELN